IGSMWLNESAADGCVYSFEAGQREEDHRPRTQRIHMAAADIRIKRIGEVMASLFVTKRSGCNDAGENETTVTKYAERLSPDAQSTIPYIRSPASPSPGTM